ncbi:MAG: EAL domain-containing protein [Rhodopseudomonas sp.]|nr:EAL domain-containing protein [Rhodopseudomonas sp.]
MMGDRVLKKMVGTIALSIAAFVAIAAPASYFTVNYLHQSEVMAFKARLTAARVAQYIYAHDELWQYQQLRLAELIQLPERGEEPLRHIIYDLSERPVLDEDPALAGPVMERRAPILIGDSVVGYTAVQRSMTPDLYGTALAAAVGLVLGFAVYFAVRSFPLRALDKALGALQRSEASLAEQNEQLRVSEAKLSDALGMARAGQWEYDFATDRFTFNDNFYRIFRTTAEAVGGYTMTSADYARRFVHPDDIALVGAEIKAAIEANDPAYRREFEHRIVYADGTFGDISVRISIVKDEHGRTIKSCGVNQDITERKRVQLALAESELKLTAALNNMSHGLCMFDADGKLVIFNARFLEIYGLADGRLKPGMTTPEMMALGGIDGTAEDVDPDGTLGVQANFLRDGKAGSMIQRLSDGRSIAISWRPKPEGGFVAIFEDITERLSAEAKIQFLAHHDALTHLPNRVAFYERMDEVVDNLRRDEAVAVLSLDLDHFKGVNDTLGHPIGDRLLQCVAERIRHCIRDEDIVARLGGDEFAVVQVPTGNPSEIGALASRLIEIVGAPYEIDGHQVVVGASIGIAMAPSDSDVPDVLMKDADLALYRAKAEGGGVYRFFEIEMDTRMQARRVLELDLRKAIVNAEFEMYYQPITDIKSGRISSFEALIRWHHPERGIVAPVEFIPVAEETGLIVPVGEWILRQACKEAAGWPDNVTVAVNLSPAQFKSKNLVPTVISALATSGLPASRLELEITETVLVQESDGAFELLHQLRNLGIRIAMDDFGTGYSSLAYLRSFPFDKIKIDQSFIRDLPAKKDSVAIVRAVVGLSSSLGITTTAEGVETREQLESVAAEGCTEVQGYLFSQPKPASEVARILREQNPAIEAVA